MEIVFIVGTGRCGSSLLHEVLARHEGIGFISNIDDRLYSLNMKGRLNNAIFRGPLGRYTKKGRPRFAPSEGYQIISHHVSPSYEKPCRDLIDLDVTNWLAERYKTFFNDRIEAQNKPIFLHKYTGWSRMRFFGMIFPKSKFIHVIRDGRAVANSFLQMPWWDGYRGAESWIYGKLVEPYYADWINSNRSFVTLAGITWKMLLESYKDSISTMPGRCLEIKYEDFVDEPVSTLDNILTFSGLEWTDKFRKTIKELRIDANRKIPYEKDLTPLQCVELEKCLRSHLVEYGYALRYI